MFESDPVTVMVPATSANLGPGYDCLGLALGLEDRITVRVVDAGIRVTVVGEGSGEVSDGPDNLVVATMLRTFEVLGCPAPPGLEVRCDNRIPHTRGLGSSSAAIVAGIVLARTLADVPDDPAAVVRLAAALEGHPDNVAACALGGLTIAWPGPDGAHAVRLATAAGLDPVVYVPASRGLTAQARAALPATVPHADAAFNVARTALLVHALTGDPNLLLAATEDRLHQGYRADAYPASSALVARLRAAGVPAVISGAGPTVLALVAPADDHTPAGWCSRSLSIATMGARIVNDRHAGGDPVAAGLPS